MSCMPMDKKKILVASSQNLLAEGICLLIENSNACRSIGCATTMQSLKTVLQQGEWDAVVLAEPSFDFPLSFVARQIQNISPFSPIIALQTGPLIFSASCMLKNGIRAWFPPDCNLNEFLDALNKVERGEIYVSDYMAERIAYEVSGREAPHMMLTDREAEVLFFLIRGFGLTKTAKLLFTRIETVSRYAANIKRSLGVNNMSELIQYSFKHEILP